MKKTKKAIALLTAAALAAAMAGGCSGGGSSSSGSAGSSAGGESADVPTVSFSVITAGFGADPTGTVIQEEWLRMCGEKMGVKLDPKYQYVNSSDYGDKIQIILTGGDIPDLLSYGFSSGGQADLIKYGDQGLFVELTEHMDKMPNYKKVIDAAPKSMVSLYSTENKLYAFYGAQYQPVGFPSMLGSIGVRQDILDANNLKVPETIDEYTALCEKLKEIYPDKYPMTQIEEWASPESSPFAANHTSADITGRTNSRLYDGKEYIFAPLTDNYKEALQTVNEWYTKGLISPDYFTQTQTDGFAAVASGEALTSPALWDGYPGIWAQQYPDQKWTLVPALKNPKYGEPWAYWGSSPDEWVIQKGYSVLVGSQSKVIDYMLQLMDLQYSDDVFNLLNWGIKDMTYTEDAEGNKTIVQKYLDEPDLQTQLGWGQGTCRSGIFPNPQDITYRFATYPSADIYDKGKIVHEVPSLFSVDKITPETTSPVSVLYPAPSALTSEESQQYANIMTPIETYCAEQASAFIKGTRSFDEWDAYLEEVKAMGDIQGAMDIYNSHLPK